MSPLTRPIATRSQPPSRALAGYFAHVHAEQACKVVDPATGEILSAQAFVAVLGHSGYT